MQQSINRDFRLQILMCYNSPIIEQWTPLAPNIPYFLLILLLNWTIFATFIALSEGLQMFFGPQKKHRNVLSIWIFVILKALGERLQMFFGPQKKHRNVLSIWIFAILKALGERLQMFFATSEA